MSVHINRLYVAFMQKTAESLVNLPIPLERYDSAHHVDESSLLKMGETRFSFR